MTSVTDGEAAQAGNLLEGDIIEGLSGTTWGRKPEKSGFVTRSSRYGTAGLNPTITRA